MILAAGRGERMRPLSDGTPKPLLTAGGKPLIVWQIEALARAGFCDIVINVSHHARQMMDVLGDGAALGVRIAWSVEIEPLEVAGGIATALPLLPRAPALIVSGDIWTAFDYASVAQRAHAIAHDLTAPRAHLVMVPNPPFHPSGDFVLRDGMLAADDGHRLTYGNIGVYDIALFAALPRGARLQMLPLFLAWIGRGIVSGERYDGSWANVGTPDDLMALDARLSTPVSAP
jgi:MurNAc alpha-1-phosphate uridylyltransferase